jgi:hypothetical protein
MSWVRAAAVVMLAIGLTPARAAAQDTSELARLEIAAAALWASGHGLDTPNATLRDRSGQPVMFFNTDSDLGSAVGGEARVGVRVSRSLQAEFAAAYTRPSLNVHVSSDVEDIPDVTATDKMHRVSLEGALLVHLAGQRIAGGVPYMVGAAGYVRQLHENRTLSEGGVTGSAGGGVYFPFGGPPLGRGAGVRVDARAMLADGMSVDDKLHVSVAVRAALSFRF